MILGLVCHIIMAVSRRDGDFIMGALTLILSLIAQDVNPARNSSLENSRRQLPTTMETLLSKFRVQGQFTTYVACPACHCSYKPLPGPSPYPQRCTNQPTPGVVCDEPLLDNAGSPFKTFLHYSFRDYLASLLSNPVLEKAMDDAAECLRVFGSSTMHAVHGPFEAEFLKQFKGPDGQLFFSAGKEGRYLFSMCVDFFNVEGMNIRGARTSCGIIALACLNLPIEIRYKPENMYLAIIVPGPKEPSLTDLNHYVRPVVDDMVESWHFGTFFSRTALHKDGRLTRSAIANVVCDLPAARKTAALAPSTAKIFCNVCMCWHERDAKGRIIKSWRKLLGRTDFDEWGVRDVEEMRSAAEQWRDATSISQREAIFAEYGVRWSELWRLPYWNPTKQLVVDSMHCLFEGLASHNYLQVLGLTDTVAAAAAKSPPRPAFAWQFARPDDEDEQCVPAPDDAAEPSSDVEDVAEPSDELPANAKFSAAELVWTPKQLKDLAKVHTLLVTALREGDGEEGITPVELKAKLGKRLLPCLRFVTEDLGLSVFSRRNVPRRDDFAAALVDWVSALAF